MKKLLLTFIVVLLLALCFGCSDDKPSQNDVQLNKQYTNETDGFSLSLPDQWEYLSTSTAQTFLNQTSNNERLLYAYDSQDKNSIGNIGVVVDKYTHSNEFSYEIATEDYFKERCEESNATYDSFAELLQNDIPAKKITYTIKNYKNKELCVTEYYYSLGDAIYVARYFFPKSDGEVYKSTLVEIENSYKITGITEQSSSSSSEKNKEDILVDIYRSAIFSITNEQLELPDTAAQLINNNFEQFAIWQGGEKDIEKFQELIPDELYPWDQIDGNKTPYIRSDVVLHRNGTVLFGVSEEIEDGSGIYLTIIQLLYDNLMAAAGAHKEQLYTLLYLGKAEFQPGAYIGFYGIPIGYYTVDGDTEAYLIVTGCFD